MTASKIKTGAVTGAAVKDGSLGAADLAPGTITSDGEVFSGLGNAELPVSLDGTNFRCGPVGGAGCP